MHNSPEKNLRFAVQWATTNLQYLLGAEHRDEKLIARQRKIIKDNTAKLAKIPNPYWPNFNCLGTPLAH